jgi:hypothetical protein
LSQEVSITTSKISLGCCLIALLIGPSIAVGQETVEPNNFARLGLDVLWGYCYLLYDFGPNSLGSNNIKPIEGQSLGALLSLRLQPHSMIEWNFIRTGLTGSEAFPWYNADWQMDVDVAVSQISMDVKYLWDIFQLEPYAKLGIGYYFYHIDSWFYELDSQGEKIITDNSDVPQSDNDSSFGYVVGFGLDYQPWSYARIGFELRSNLAFANGLSLFAFTLSPRIGITY